MLTGKQRAFLRAMANTENAIIQVGKTGINENLIIQIDEALEARELIKITVLDNSPSEVREMVEKIANQVSAEIVQVIGKKFSIYRESKKPIIILP